MRSKGRTDLVWVASYPGVMAPRARLHLVEPGTTVDVAALAIHLMTNTAMTGGTYDIDGGQQLVA